MFEGENEMSSRCEVKMYDDYVIKQYKVSESYLQEKETYDRLSNKAYIPKMLFFDDKNMTIKLQRISAMTLSEYINRNRRVPYNLAKDLKKILLEMAEVGIVDTPDFYKFEHIYVTEDEKIVVIDFDVNIAFPFDNPNFQEMVNMRIESIEKEYCFLTGDANAWAKFKKMLYKGGVSEAMADDFYCNMVK